MDINRWSNVKRFRMLGLRRMLSAPLRSLPHFLIIGAMKSGTTSLYTYLIQHPQVVRGMRKEVHLFDNAPRLGFLYRAYFPLRMNLRDYKITGEATPRYITRIEYAQHAAKIVPSAKIIVLLRNPVERAYSHFKHAERIVGRALDFEEMVQQEIEALGQPDYDLPEYWEAEAHLVKRGLYAAQIRDWLQFFPRDQVLILQAEKLFDDPQTITAAVCTFLGIDEDPTETFTYAARNTSESRGSNAPPHVYRDTKPSVPILSTTQ